MSMYYTLVHICMCIYIHMYMNIYVHMYASMHYVCISAEKHDQFSVSQEIDISLEVSIHMTISDDIYAWCMATEAAVPGPVQRGAQQHAACAWLHAGCCRCVSPTFMSQHTRHTRPPAFTKHNNAIHICIYVHIYTYMYKPTNMQRRVCLYADILNVCIYT